MSNCYCHPGKAGGLPAGLGRLVWKILHDGVRDVEQGEETTPQAKKRRTKRLTQALRKLGYAVTLQPINPGPASTPAAVTG